MMQDQIIIASIDTSTSTTYEKSGWKTAMTEDEDGSASRLGVSEGEANDERAVAPPARVTGSARVSQIFRAY